MSCERVGNKKRGIMKAYMFFANLAVMVSAVSAGEWTRYDVDVTEVRSTASNTLILTLDGGNATLDPGTCDGFQLAGSSADALKSMLSIALTAKATGSKLKLQFNDDGGCSLGRYKVDDITIQ